MIDFGRRFGGHDRFGAVGQAQPRRPDHRQVVGAIADRERVLRRGPVRRRFLAQSHELGFAAQNWLRDGAESERVLMRRTHDLALLDLGLPRRDGLEILKSLRRAQNDMPIVVITARDSVSDRVAGLDSGEDDYLVKPFDLDELLLLAAMAFPIACIALCIQASRLRREILRRRAIDELMTELFYRTSQPNAEWQPKEALSESPQNNF